MTHATPTPSTDETIRPVGQSPAVQAAERGLASASERAADVEQRWSAALHVATSTDVDLAALLEAKIQLKRLDDEQLASRLALRRAERELDHAREVERERLRQLFFARRRDLVGRLAEKLDEAAQVSRELMQVENAERELTGAWHMSGTAWPELEPERPTQASRHATWTRAVIADGLLDPRDGESDEE